MSPAEGNYPEGTQLQLTAEPTDGWRFVAWSGHLGGSTNPAALTVNQATDVTALFERKTYTLQVDVVGEGAVYEEIDQTAGKDYPHQTEVRLTARPADGWRFVRWERDLTGVENPVSLTVDQPLAVRAVFERSAYALQVDVVGEGTVQEEVVQAAGKDYPYGTQVRLTATAADGWRFVRWEGNLTGSTNPATVAVDHAVSVTAVFERRSYPLDVTVRGEGRVFEEVVSTPGKDHPSGTEVRLTAQAADGWRFAGWEGDLSGGANPATIVIDAAKTVTAVFERSDYTLGIEVVGSGTVGEEVIEAPGKEYPSGTQVRLTATPAEGWRFVRWTGDLTGTDNPSILRIDRPMRVTAVFERKSYALVVAVRGEGQVFEEVVSGAGKDHPYGTQVRLTAMPANGWRFVGWEGDLSGSTNPATLTIDQPTTVTAVFQLEGYFLTTDVVGEGTVTKEAVVEDNQPYPTHMRLTARPSEGWRFVRWTGDLGGSENPAVLLMDRRKSVTAVFERVDRQLDVTIVGQGQVFQEIEASPGKAYPHGTRLRLTAQPAAGWRFNRWDGDLTGTTGTADIVMDTDKHVVAYFEAEPFSLQLSVVGNGTIDQTTVQPPGAPSGHQIRLTARPASGWTFVHWSGDLDGSINPSIILMDQNKQITAHFEQAGSPVPEPLAQYPLDGNALDASGNGFHGTVYGAAGTADRLGRPGSALRFDGIDDFIEIGNAAGLKPSFPVTLAAWIRIDEQKGMGLFTNNFDLYVNNGIWIAFAADGKAAVSYGDGGPTGSGSQRTKRGDTRFQPGVWYHYAAVVQADGTATIYVNGRDDGGYYDGFGTGLSYSGGPANFGRRSSGHNPAVAVPIYFKGAVDEFYFFDRALTTAEIALLMEQ